MTKIAWLVSLSGLILALVSAAAISWQWPDEYVHVIFCDVGQGDAILITSGFTQVLVDSGPDESVFKCLRSHLPIWDVQLEAVVGTHADQDHIGGFPGVLSNYQIQTGLVNEYGKTATDFLDYWQGLMHQRQSRQTRLFRPLQGDRYSFDGFSLFTLSPQERMTDNRLFNSHLTETQLSAVVAEHEMEIENYNNGSIVLLLEVGQVKILLTGDLEADGEQALLNSGLISKVDVLKVGHHGSKTSTSPEFLAQLRPEFAVISCGQKNTFGHPALVTLETLHKNQSHILRTDQQGEIELISDGTRYWFDEQK